MTWLQAPKLLWLCGGIISPSYSMCMRLTTGPEPSGFEVKLAIDKLKSHKSPGIDEIPAELIKAGGGTICLEIHKLITSVWKK